MKCCAIWCVAGLIAALAAGCGKDSKPSQDVKATQEVDVGGKTEGPPNELTVDLGGGQELLFAGESLANRAPAPKTNLVPGP